MTRTEKARDAALFADPLAFALLGASTPNATTEERLHHLVKAFTIWPSLAKRMSELEQLCPNCSAEGREASERLQHIAERVG